MKFSKELGTISMQLAGLIGTAALIALLAGGVWIQQVRLDAAVVAKKAAEEQLNIANTRITEIADINKRLDETIGLIKSISEVNKEQAIIRAEDSRKLVESVNKVTKTLPVVKAKVEEKPQSKDQVDNSFKRALAMQEAFCLTDPSNDMCFKLQSSTELKKNS